MDVHGSEITKFETILLIGIQILNRLQDFHFKTGFTYNNINPTNFFGGVWEQIKDKFLLACGDNHVNGTTGGEETHTLTINEMPPHTHNISTHGRGTVMGSGFSYVSQGGWNQYFAQSTGNGEAHNNMPPYLAVYMWKRTA